MLKVGLGMVDCCLVQCEIKCRPDLLDMCPLSESNPNRPISIPKPILEQMVCYVLLVVCGCWLIWLYG